MTLFPSSIEDVVRGIPMLGPEFAIVLTKEHDLDVLIVQVEALPEFSTERYAEIADQVEREVRSSCELRAVIEVLPQEKALYYCNHSFTLLTCINSIVEQ